MAHLGTYRERLGAIGGSPGRPGLTTPEAIEAIHAEITFAALEQNPNFKQEHEFHDMFLKVKGPGDSIFSNLKRGINLP